MVPTYARLWVRLAAVVVAPLAVAHLGCRDEGFPSRPAPAAAPQAATGPGRTGAELEAAGGPRTPMDAAGDGAAPGPSFEASTASDAARDLEAGGSARVNEAPPPLGPFLIPFLPSRAAYVVLPSSGPRPHRLVAGLHGVCTPPSYSCGSWLHAAAEAGILVCPTGNAPCDDVPGAPTWDEPFAKIDEDLERSIAKVAARYPGGLTREGAILTGYSRGAYAAAIIATRHPGRWPLLVLTEADVELSLTSLRAARVRAVALIAGEWGTQIAGERKNADDLAAQGYPIRLWVMPRAGHPYSANIDDIMREALTFVLSHAQDG